MGDWIEQLKRQEDDLEKSTSQKREWQLYCDRVFAAKGPSLWRSIVEEVDTQVRRLAATFPDQSSKQLCFSDQGDRFTVENPAKRTELTVQWFKDEWFIGLGLYTRKGMLSEQHCERDEVKLTVSASGEVQMELRGESIASVNIMSEQLLKKLL